MKKIYMCVLGIGAMMMLQSCYVQTLSVGMNEGDPVKQVAVVKNHQFIDGLVEPRYDKVENYVEDTQHFKVTTKQTFMDGFLSGLTFGIYTPSTTYYYQPAE